jgi:hypothetical protein
MNSKEINEEYQIADFTEQVISKEEAQNLQKIEKEFLKSYIEKGDLEDKVWLARELQKNLQDYSPEEIEAMSTEIVDSLKVTEEKKDSLEKAIANGRSKESWLADSLKASTSHMSVQDKAKYLQSLDEAVKKANIEMFKTIHRKDGMVSMNPHLDGYIAEEYHAQTFNLNATATGSQYRAEALKPDGKRYGKNSVDDVIRDAKDDIVNKFQSKYGMSPEATEAYYSVGDYRGQQKLVPAGQGSKIHKKSTEVMVAPDGTTSNPLSKEDAVRMRDEAQSGNWKEFDWNDYKTKDLVVGIGQQVGYATLQGAAVGAGLNLVSQVCNGEKIDGGEVIESAVESGADFGVKTALAGAMKVSSEKGIIEVLPKGTSASAFANVAFVAVENIKVLGKVASGELDVHQGLDKMQQTTVSCVAGLATGALAGAKLGAALFSVVGPVGTAVGGFVGGALGYMAGSKIGETVVKGAQKLRDAAVKTVKSVWEGAKQGVSSFLHSIFA